MKNKAFLVEYCRTEVSLSHPADYDVNCQPAATTRAFFVSQHAFALIALASPAGNKNS
jgi:hypothetical protein